MKHALIIGGGIAGPIAGIALQQAGIRSTVFEASEASAGLEAGAWLTVAVNGLDVLRTLCLHQAVMGCGFPSRTIQLHSGTGKLLGEVPIGGTLEDGTVTHTLKRGDLYRLLNEEARRRGVRFEHGKRLVDAELAPDGGVHARFRDGSEERGTVLVGADGIHSRTRRIIDPQNPEPRYSGLGNVGGVTRAGAVDLAPGTYKMYFGRGCFFGVTVSPSGEIWWFANPASRQELSRERLAATTSDQWKEYLIELFAEDATPAPAIIRDCTDKLAVFNQSSMPPVPTWRRGSMVIIGDAAHAASPTSGQGASMAMEDGLELARCLRDIPDVPRALATYEHLRRVRVEQVVAYGQKMSGFKLGGPVARMMRDLVLPWILRRQTQRANPGPMAWLFNHHIAWNESAADSRNAPDISQTAA